MIAGVRRKSNWIDDWQKLSDEGGARPVYSPRFPQKSPPDYEETVEEHAFSDIAYSAYAPPPFVKNDVKNRLEHKNFYEKEFIAPGFTSEGIRSHHSQVPPRSNRLRSYASARSHPFYWIYEEISFTMSKLSVFGAILSLCILAALLFIGGFLTAYNFYTHQEVRAPGNPWVIAHQAPTSQEGGGPTSTHTKHDGGGFRRFASHNPLARQANQASHHLMAKPAAALHKFPGLSSRGGAPSQFMNQVGRQGARALRHPVERSQGGRVSGGYVPAPSQSAYNPEDSSYGYVQSPGYPAPYEGRGASPKLPHQASPAYSGALKNPQFPYSRRGGGYSQTPRPPSGAYGGY